MATDPVTGKQIREVAQERLTRLLPTQDERALAARQERERLPEGLTRPNMPPRMPDGMGAGEHSKQIKRWLNGE